MTEIILAIAGGGVGAAIVGGVFSLVQWKLNRRAAKEDKRSNMAAGIRILLYDRIKYLGRKHIADGYITAEDLEDLTAMHKIYHDDLSGNGFLDTLMSQVKILKITK